MAPFFGLHYVELSMTKLKGHVLIVDDDLDVLHTIRFLLKTEFEKVEVESNPQQLSYLLNNKQYDVILLDMNYTAGATSGKEGLFWLKQVKSLENPPQVVMMTAYGDIKLAVESMKFGAFDFVVKPWENEKFIATVKSAFNHSRSIQELNDLKSKQQEINEQAIPRNEIVGNSSQIKQVIGDVDKVAPTDASLLILGENGTGKEIIAQYTHQISDRRQHPFIKVDMGAITESLFESELFGHKKGAFTDAKTDKTGRLVLAGKGTLFLDEIGNLSLPMQAKLLSVLQNREVIPVGASKPEPINARIISATNEDLNARIADGTFREDLLYRLNTVELTLPPLRERPEDIELLAEHFLTKFNTKYRKNATLANETLDMLRLYTWPGNIRELMHAIERALIMTDNNVLNKEDFILKDEKRERVNSLNLDENEKAIIQQALLKHNGNVSKAAKELGLGRTTIYRKLDKYGINY